jgi:cytochrome c oxidase assembly protein subunit 15
MWTVTLLLKPVVVVAHLLGGLATLGLLFWLSDVRTAPVPGGAKLRALGVAALAVLVLQIALGGWTSANYAALACPDLPTCQTQWWPEIADFGEAFVLWRGLGIDYEGGVLEHPARVAIHLTHRIGAVIVSLVIGALGILALARARSTALRMAGIGVLAALALQLAIGIFMVTGGLPLLLATAHNAGAAVLLLAVISLLRRVCANTGS